MTSRMHAVIFAVAQGTGELWLTMALMAEHSIRRLRNRVFAKNPVSNLKRPDDEIINSNPLERTQ